ncbi:uncharacterized protein RSE6_03781 [Rhynchosporium secalis]|uniref:Uncharacterized protein n=1 Tax=Rhynchosporium secalis TaxID=38038 RepID=A0A1E1M3N0_RHYSE|nr:uncharacterized protein RSE6_03781 [Rhynchosporium secalis]
MASGISFLQLLFGAGTFECRMIDDNSQVRSYKCVHHFRYFVELGCCIWIGNVGNLIGDERDFKISARVAVQLGIVSREADGKVVDVATLSIGSCWSDFMTMRKLSEEFSQVELARESCNIQGGNNIFPKMHVTKFCGGYR